MSLDVIFLERFPFFWKIFKILKIIRKKMDLIASIFVCKFYGSFLLPIGGGHV